MVYKSSKIDKERHLKINLWEKICSKHGAPKPPSESWQQRAERYLKVLSELEKKGSNRENIRTRPRSRF